MIRVLGLRVDEYDMEQSLDIIQALLNQPAATAYQVITINPEGLWLAAHDPNLAAIVDQAALVTPDGTGVLWAARRLGHSLKERVAGVELMERLCQRGAEQGWPVYLLGAAPGVAEAAAAKLRGRYPGLIIAGCHDGYFRDQEEEVIAAIREAQPRLLFAALGMPYQERWLYQRRAEFPGLVCMGVGGSFDVLAGRVKRAPRLWRRLGLEWLWRLLSDPRRWRRALIIPRFMLAVIRESRRS